MADERSMLQGELTRLGAWSAAAVALAASSALLLVPSCSAGLEPGPDGGAADAGPGDAGVNPQQHYSYPGCEDAGSYVCPNLLVFYCALHSIEDAHRSGCVDDGDCALVPFHDCGGVFGCRPPAVLGSKVAAFSAAAGAEREKYCDGGLCVSAPDCPAATEAYRPFCLQGRCVALVPDGGAGTDGGMDGGDDAGTTDAGGEDGG